MSWCRPRLPFVLIGLVSLLLGTHAGSGATHAAAPGVAGSQARIVVRYGALPLHFEPNRGQAPSSVRYLARGANYSIALTNTGAVLSLAPSRVTRPALFPARTSNTTRTTSRAVVRLTWTGASQHTRITAGGRLQGVVNYLMGSDPRGWRTDIPTFSTITYHHLYPGIDLVFHGHNGRFEYDWVIHPHANPQAIAMRVSGVSTVGRHDGDLVLHPPLGSIRQTAPRVYQVVHRRRVPVAGGYRVFDGNRVRYRLGRYDRSREVVIDPVLAYGTYLGDDTYGGPIAVDGSGDAYITGETDATIPIRQPYQPLSGGGYGDAFVTKLNPSGSDLVFSTYLGGIGWDGGDAITLDSSNDVFLGIHTNSANFPGLPPGLVTSSQGLDPKDGATVVLELQPSGAAIVFEHAEPVANGVADIAVNPAGDVYYAQAQYVNAKPRTAVTELSPTGAVLHTLTISSNADGSGPSGLALDAQGNVWVTGATDSTDFPVPNGLFTVPSGKDDAYLMELTPALGEIYGTYIGGSGDDVAAGVAVGSNGSIYIGGYTSSTNYPAAAALQYTLAGKTNGFISVLAASGNHFVYSTYIGGDNTDIVNGIDVDLAGDAYIAGNTNSDNFPTADPLPGSGYKTGDAFVTEISASRKLVYSTYLGGGANDSAQGIAVDGAGNAYVSGTTFSSDFPTSSNAYQKQLEGIESAFVVRIGAPLSATPTPTSTSVPGATATATSTPTSTSTPDPTDTPQPTATGTSIPPATATPTATATATATATPTVPPTSTPTTAPTPTRVPAPRTPHIVLNSSHVAGGGKLKLTVTTTPHAAISAVLKAKHGRKVLFSVTKRGAANASGRWSVSLKIGFHPSTSAGATLTVKAKTSGGSASNTRHVTIVPHG